MRILALFAKVNVFENSWKGNSRKFVLAKKNSESLCSFTVFILVKKDFCVYLKFLLRFFFSNLPYFRKFKLAKIFETPKSFMFAKIISLSNSRKYVVNFAIFWPRESLWIGVKTQKNIRPIKVVLESGHERYLLLKNLINVREKPKFEQISIKEDFTPFERSIIRDWTNRANERNLKEPKDSKIVWRVRRSPSKSLYLKKYQKHQK